jgi:glycosyltransferase involved in cell wall biosynthesis
MSSPGSVATSIPKDKPLRILAVTQLYPTPDNPTFAAYNRQQFAQLARFNELTVVRPFPWPMALRQWLREGRRPEMYTHEDGIRVHMPTYFYPPRIYHHRYGSFFERSVRGVAESLVQSSRPDVLLGSWAHPDGWAAVRLGKRTDIPVVVKVHGSDVLVLARGRRHAPIVEALAAADKVIAVSEDLAAHVRALGIPNERVAVVHHGIDVVRFSPGDQSQAFERLGATDRRRLILFVGRVVLAKGLADLVSACAVLRDRGLDYQCQIVGGGKDEATVRQLVRRAHLEGFVGFPGNFSHSELPDWYRASTLVVLPSRSEGIPNVLREAVACGKPFVATRVGGIPEIAHPSFSRLVSPGAPAELADALAQMLKSPPVVDAEQIRRISISWEQSARLLSEHLKAAVENRRRGVCRADGLQ